MLVIGPHGRALRGDASIAPYILYFAIENLGPEGVNMENGLKALRKMQHSCTV